MIIAEGMNKISDALTDIRNQYGQSVIENIPRLRALLSDYCPQYRQEARIFTYVISDEGNYSALKVSKINHSSKC